MLFIFQTHVLARSKMSGCSFPLRTILAKPPRWPPAGGGAGWKVPWMKVEPATGKSLGRWEGTRPGKQPQKTMENHHVFNGKIHYFDWAIFNSKLLRHNQMVLPPIKINQGWNTSRVDMTNWNWNGIGWWMIVSSGHDQAHPSRRKLHVILCYSVMPLHLTSQKACLGRVHQNLSCLHPPKFQEGQLCQFNVFSRTSLKCPHPENIHLNIESTLESKIIKHPKPSKKQSKTIQNHPKPSKTINQSHPKPSKTINQSHPKPSKKPSKHLQKHLGWRWMRPRFHIALIRRRDADSCHRGSLPAWPVGRSSAAGRPSRESDVNLGCKKKPKGQSWTIRNINYPLVLN